MFTTQCDSVLAPLAWHATLANGTLMIRHGTAVETSPFGIVAGVWDGDFDAWDFHEAEHLFGSGVRVERDEIHFVPSCAHVDRLLYFHDGDALHVSNSLLTLLAATGARLCPERNYIAESHAIARGIDAYRSELPVQHATIPAFHQLYHDSLVVCDGVSAMRRRTHVHDFPDFASYANAMRQAVHRIGRNLRGRLGVTATVSSGYDSPTVAVLAREIGLEHVHTSAWSNSTLARSDSGAAIAERLGLRVSVLPSVREVDESEALFSAVGPTAPELIFHGLFRDRTPRVLFTGYYGDTAWGTTTHAEMRTGAMVWPTLSGLSIAEACLHAGVVHAPLPFLFARSIESIYRISHNAEMRPWRLDNAYDRPIPRRIVEDAGIPRAWFGQRKKAVVQHYRVPFSTELRRDFFARCASPLRVRVQAALDPIHSLVRGASAEPSAMLHHWAVDYLLHHGIPAAHDGSASQTLNASM